MKTLNIAEYRVVKEFSASYRWQHWLTAVSIVILTISGFYIAVPFISPGFLPQPTGFLQAYIRFAHLAAGFLIIAFFIFKFYMLFFTKEHAHEIESYKDCLKLSNWLKQAGYYLLISKHPKQHGTYNPLQFAAYIGFYVMLFILIITGLILYVNVYYLGLAKILYTPMRELELLCGGLANVRIIHHILTWCVILFVIAHVHLVIFNAIFRREGCMDSIVSGYRWKKDH